MTSPFLAQTNILFLLVNQQFIAVQKEPPSEVDSVVGTAKIVRKIHMIMRWQRKMVKEKKMVERKMVKERFRITEIRMRKKINTTKK
jgi:ubiquinone biosynthesis protein Coq4